MLRKPKKTDKKVTKKSTRNLTSNHNSEAEADELPPEEEEVDNKNIIFLTLE